LSVKKKEKGNLKTSHSLTVARIFKILSCFATTKLDTQEVRARWRTIAGREA
jgi:hypothetical protein